MTKLQKRNEERLERLGDAPGTVQPGLYYLGDPCYTRSGLEWRPVSDRVFSRDDVLGFHTEWGDGEFADQFGNLYSVDSGMIGLVPVHTATRKRPFGVHRVRFLTATRCSKKHGVLKFGEFEVDTRAALVERKRNRAA